MKMRSSEFLCAAFATTQRESSEDWSKGFSSDPTREVKKERQTNRKVEKEKKGEDGVAKNKVAENMRQRL